MIGPGHACVKYNALMVYYVGVQYALETMPQVHCSVAVRAVSLLSRRPCKDRALLPWTLAFVCAAEAMVSQCLELQ